MRFHILAAALVAVASAATKQQYAPPVAILKQIDKHNEDGSYSYGYEAADGTFKIETKYPDGEVYGKYGYVDDTGTLREVEYGASRRGFEPSGNEIQVAPPTLKKGGAAAPPKPLGPEEEDDGQYCEDPAMYYKDDGYAQPVPQQRAYQRPTSRYQAPQSVFEPEYEPEPYRPAYRPTARPQSSYRPQSYYARDPEPEYSPEPAHRPQPAFRPEPTYRPEPAYRPEPVYRPEPAYRPEPVYRPEPARPSYRPQIDRPKSNFGFSNNNDNFYSPPSYNSNYNSPPAQNNYNGPSWQGHPATNVDINTGSYSVNYKR